MQPQGRVEVRDGLQVAPDNGCAVVVNLLDVLTDALHSEHVVVGVLLEATDHVGCASADHLQVQVLQLPPQVTLRLALSLRECYVDQAAFASLTADRHKAQLYLA